MKPVIIQNLIKKMRDRIGTLPEPTADTTEHEPVRRDRTGSILITIFVIAIVIMFILL